MATTTNYSWSTPDDTALVKDGAAAIRSLGSAIDSTVFTNASAAVAKTIVDAKGDIIAATAADTVSRLAVGADDTVLTADSTAATGLKWATVAGGGMTLLSTTSLSGATVTVSGISGSYQDLMLVISRMTNDTADGQAEIRFNASTTIHQTSGTRTTSAVENDGQFFLAGDSTPNFLRTNTENVFVIRVNNYAQTSYIKPLNSSGFFRTTASLKSPVNIGGALRTTSAITSFTLLNTGGNLNGGEVKVYGIK